MSYRARVFFHFFWFNLNVRSVARSSPARCEPGAAFVLVSQVCHRDVWLYLLALKSFTRFLRPRRIVALDDMTLTGRDKVLLSRHAEQLTTVPIRGITAEGCPRGGAWERLLYISRLAPSDYVIQLDSDTLTLQPPAEVEAAITANRSFTLGTPLGGEIVSMQKAWQAAQGFEAEDYHVQVVAEKSFDQLEGYHSLKYVRGNAAFAGFARGSFGPRAVQDFSMHMSALVSAKKWSEWGSEQVTSNYIIANSTAAFVLPLPHYSYYYPELPLADCKFLHFIGMYRFTKGTYVRLGRNVAAELLAGGTK